MYVYLRISSYPFVQFKFSVYGRKQTYIHTHASCNAVTLVWGSLRLAPITPSFTNALEIQKESNSAAKNNISTAKLQDLLSTHL